MGKGIPGKKIPAKPTPAAPVAVEPAKGDLFKLKKNATTAEGHDIGGATVMVVPKRGRKGESIQIHLVLGSDDEPYSGATTDPDQVTKDYLFDVDRNFLLKKVDHFELEESADTDDSDDPDSADTDDSADTESEEVENTSAAVAFAFMTVDPEALAAMLTMLLEDDTGFAYFDDLTERLSEEAKASLSEMFSI